MIYWILGYRCVKECIIVGDAKMVINCGIHVIRCLHLWTSLFCVFLNDFVLTSMSPLCLSFLSFLSNADLSLVRFISAELTRGYFLEHNEAKYTERRERVYTCLRIPRELEKVGLPAPSVI